MDIQDTDHRHPPYECIMRWNYSEPWEIVTNYLIPVNSTYFDCRAIRFGNYIIISIAVHCQIMVNPLYVIIVIIAAYLPFTPQVSLSIHWMCNIPHALFINLEARRLVYPLLLHYCLRIRTVWYVNGSIVPNTAGLYLILKLPSTLFSFQVPRAAKPCRSISWVALLFSLIKKRPTSRPLKQRVFEVLPEWIGKEIDFYNWHRY